MKQSLKPPKPGSSANDGIRGSGSRRARREHVTGEVWSSRTSHPEPGDDGLGADKAGSCGWGKKATAQGWGED